MVKNAGCGRNFLQVIRSGAVDGLVPPLAGLPAESGRLGILPSPTHAGERPDRPEPVPRSAGPHLLR